MNQTDSANAIPKEVAFQLCTKIRQQYLGKWYTLAGMQCIGCTTTSKADPTKMCVSSKPGYRGCNLVNARYDKQFKKRNQT